MLKAGADRPVQVKFITTSSIATAAGLALFFRGKAEKKSQAELLQTLLPGESSQVLCQSSHPPYTLMALSSTDLNF